MLDEEDVQEIINSWSFQTNLHILANSLDISDTEAQSLLLDECIKRHVSTPLTAVMQWRITYARKDLISRYYRDWQKNKDLENKLSVQQSPQQSLDENLKDLNINYEQLLSIIQASFPNKKTQEFVKLVFNVGSEETMAKLGLTQKQFNRKLKKACDYASHHRGKFTAIIDQQERQKLQAELAILRDYQMIINNRSSPESRIEQLIQDNYEYFEDFIGLIPNIDQCTLLRHYCMANRKDMYLLNETINTQINRIESKISTAENSAQ